MAIVLALNQISALIGNFFGNALKKGYVYFGCLSSFVRSVTKIYWRNFVGYLGISTKLIMHELKTGFNADKFATFWMLPESFYRLFAGASMPSTAIFLRARAETKNLLCEQRAV